VARELVIHPIDSVIIGFVGDTRCLLRLKSQRPKNPGSFHTALVDFLMELSSRIPDMRVKDGCLKQKIGAAILRDRWLRL